jgi:hypothetical protein
MGKISDAAAAIEEAVTDECWCKPDIKCVRCHWEFLKPLLPELDLPEMDSDPKR